jgi:hypothetical protein
MNLKLTKILESHENLAWIYFLYFYLYPWFSDTLQEHVCIDSFILGMISMFC